MYKTLAWLGVLAVLGTAQLSAQATVTLPQQPTPAGTVITNTVTAHYTDASGNTYTDATANVAVTVAFKAGIDVTQFASVNPASSSTANELTFRISNTGNGPDSVGVTSVTAAAGLTITGYKYNSTSYATLLLLNQDLAKAAAVLAGVPVGAPTTANSLIVTVVYDVAGGLGNQTLPIVLTAFSRRDASKTDAGTTDVIPPVAGSVTVTANQVGPVQRLPGNYSTTFHIINAYSSQLTFTLTPAATGAVTVPSAPASVVIAAGAATDVTVTYTVPTGAAAGDPGTLNLTATSGTYSDDANNPHAIVVVKPALTLVKTAYRDNAGAVGAVIGAGTVVPGETIWYKLTISNTGSAATALATVTDQLPAEVTYVSFTGPGAPWTVVWDAGTSTLTATAASAPALGSWDVLVKVTVK